MAKRRRKRRTRGSSFGMTLVQARKLRVGDKVSVLSIGTAFEKPFCKIVNIDRVKQGKFNSIYVDVECPGKWGNHRVIHPNIFRRE